ncbi:MULTISPECIES: pirin family protein [Providencia]|uniref:Pirin family protein n=1 Tax=Providencia huaxiensis TaxID=2027290 RepID=A0ABU2IRY4_9GAMM|nr:MULTISPECIES: pirin family protein [Providencia]MBZ3680793.1 pirin family protein [Providencia rettgeri]AXH63358.1 pirin family protein [Providencia huaxiensis]MBN6360695.1 pirin family protein [Providencia huaxiensis]MDT0131832.1 pirin family protein [Providencia huaxiensis]MDT1978238.1 pirin family protein [Providencia huaxiensis]
MKKIIGIYQSPRSHWVGDGFPVRSMFSYNDHGKYLNPFILLDRAGPFDFPSSNSANRGVGEHPHRGFETVTIVYDGEVAHHDSTGEGGVIGPGDVQWMTAASGILHQEYQSDTFMKKGGTLDMVQLWVNLPAKDKSAAPGYQLLESQSMPKVALPNDAGTLRVIAGDYLGNRGAAKTFSPLDVWDLQLNKGKTVGIPTKAGRHVGLVMLRGSMFVDGRSALNEGELMILDDTDSNILLEATEDALVLLLSGDPIDEPVVGYGPFVMNTVQEINEAINDFNSGKFGRIPETQ